MLSGLTYCLIYLNFHRILSHMPFELSVQLLKHIWSSAFMRQEFLNHLVCLYTSFIQQYAKQHHCNVFHIAVWRRVWFLAIAPFFMFLPYLHPWKRFKTEIDRICCYKVTFTAHEIVQLCYERNQIISCLDRDLAFYTVQNFPVHRYAFPRSLWKSVLATWDGVFK